jgi:hypothetical protein
MGLTPIILGETTALTSATAALSLASTACGELAKPASATSGEVALLSAAPRGIVAVHASSTNDSPTTLGSGDLVREGEATGASTGLHNNIASRQIFTA